MTMLVTPRQLNSQAQDIIQRVYLIGSAPADPHTILTDMARSVVIFGNMLQDLSDQYGKVGNQFASGLATTGKLFWGIVELSVPASVFRLPLAQLVVAFCPAKRSHHRYRSIRSATAACGASAIAMLIAVIVLALLSGFLRYYMLKAKIPPHLFGWVRVGLALVALALSAYLAINYGVRIANLMGEFESFFRWTASLKGQLSTTGHNLL